MTFNPRALIVNSLIECKVDALEALTAMLYALIPTHVQHVDGDKDSVSLLEAMFDEMQYQTTTNYQEADEIEAEDAALRLKSSDRALKYELLGRAQDALRMIMEEAMYRAEEMRLFEKRESGENVA